MTRRTLVSTLALIVCVSHSAPALGAPVEIVALSVDYFKFESQVWGIPLPTVEETLSPPKTVDMNQYSAFASGSGLEIYFTGDFGAPPPSGTVDSETNTIEVDFSSLRLDVDYSEGVFSVDDNVSLWDDSRTILTQYYDPLDAQFVLEWTGATEIHGTYGGIPFSQEGTYTALVEGTVSAVPEPTTALLVGIGLGGLAAAGRRRSLH